MAEHLIAFDGPLGTLRGVLHRPDRAGDLPGIVLLHGFTGQHIEDQRLFVQAGRFLAEDGYAVLRMDFYGSGNSDGAFDAMTVHSEVDDAVAMLDWFCAQPGIDPGRFAVVGLSLGGAIAALLAAFDRRVKAAVFWNAVAEPRLHFGEIALKGPQAGVTGGLRVSRAFLETFYAMDVAGAVQRYGGPGLVIRGTADDVVLAQEADALTTALGAHGTLRLIEGADHTFRHPAWRADLFAITAAWLRAHV